jgi:hypothetical protein
MIEVKSLTFMLGEVEPFFAKLALFDVSKKSRISENFYFDMNSKKIRDLLGNHLVPFQLEKKLIENRNQSTLKQKLFTQYFQFPKREIQTFG